MEKIQSIQGKNPVSSQEEIPRILHNLNPEFKCYALLTSFEVKPASTQTVKLLADIMTSRAGSLQSQKLEPPSIANTWTFTCCWTGKWYFSPKQAWQARGTANTLLYEIFCQIFILLLSFKSRSNKCFRGKVFIAKLSILKIHTGCSLKACAVIVQSTKSAALSFSSASVQGEQAVLSSYWEKRTLIKSSVWIQAHAAIMLQKN